MQNTHRICSYTNTPAGFLQSVSLRAFPSDVHTRASSSHSEKSASLSTSSRMRITFVDITQRISGALSQKETQTITDLITPELYRSCCSVVFTQSDMAETTAQTRTGRRFPSRLFLTRSLSQTTKNPSVRHELRTEPEGATVGRGTKQITIASNCPG